MESTNRVDEYIKATKDMSSESITDMIYDIDENISNIEKDIMDKISKNEDASALMEQVQEESLRRHIYKYIIARRKSNTASKKWENFKEKFIINSEQENIFNDMRNSQRDFEDIEKSINDESEKLEKEAAELKYRIAYNCLRLFDYKTIIEGTIVVTDDLQSTIELDCIKKLVASLEDSIIKDRIKLASLNKRLCFMLDFYGREHLEKNEQLIFSILKKKLENNSRWYVYGNNFYRRDF